MVVKLDVKLLEKINQPSCRGNIGGRKVRGADGVIMNENDVAAFSCNCCADNSFRVKAGRVGSTLGDFLRTNKGKRPVEQNNVS